jgi:ketosteroid isomerase-like protein
MTNQTATTGQEQIRALLNDRAAAITARDARSAVAHYGPEVATALFRI